ncbi:MAG TPA: ectoine/hydroxyectoine ABC transporter permease subunit EhuD [bacterium]|nr:ectoine/hydroxyectoine ABC transporter permease subunit EhuD [bacterium]
MMHFDWAFTLQILPLLARAALTTIEATVIGYAFALVAGLLLALLRRSRRRWISWPVGLFIEFIRSTPLLVQLYFLFFVFPDYGIVLSGMVAGVLGLGIHYSTYTSEVYRAGLESIPRGQWEAATALGFSPLRVYTNVIIPQAVPPVVPALGNYLVGMFKDSPLLSAIAVVELMQRAKIIGSETFRYLEPVTLVGLFFIGLSLIAAYLIRRAEWRLSLAYRITRQNPTK